MITGETKTLLEKYDKLAQSIFFDMYGDSVRNSKGWKVRKLNELCTLERGRSKYRLQNAAELLGGTYLLFNSLLQKAFKVELV